VDSRIVKEKLEESIDLSFKFGFSCRELRGSGLGALLRIGVLFVDKRTFVVEVACSSFKTAAVAQIVRTWAVTG